MIRKMEQRDISSVARLEQECFSMPWSEQALKDSLGRQDALFCVCEIEKMIAGYAGMYFAYPEGEITNVAVCAQYRNRGYAKELLKYMFGEATKDGVVDYTLEVRESNVAAIRLYEQLGFKTEGIRKNFYDFPKENAFIMWKREQKVQGEDICEQMTEKSADYI